MIIDCISKNEMEREIETVICTTDDGSSDDTLLKLQNLLSMIKKYADDRGVRIVIQHGASEINELLIPYFKLRKDDCLIAIGTFGVNTPIFDIYDFHELVTKYARENTLVVTPDTSLNEEMVVLLIPLKRYYELMIQFDYKIEQLRTMEFGIRDRR